MSTFFHLDSKNFTSKLTLHSENLITQLLTIKKKKKLKLQLDSSKEQKQNFRRSLISSGPQRVN